MKRALLVLAVSAMGLSCSKSDSGTAASSAPKEASAPAEVRRIDLPKYQAELPDAEGREVFATSCLACHSTAYIGMQPPLTAAKWEDEVRKMQKVYGAPIAEEQVKPIVKYLMTVKEGDGPHIKESLVAAPAGNDLIKMARDQSDRQQDAHRGQALFGQLCASCHGEDGKGTGPAGLVLMPRPADLTQGMFSDVGVATYICNGVPGTAMAAFGKMQKNDVSAIEAYVLTLAEEQTAPDASPGGKELFAANCASCHGIEGLGDGLAGKALARPAANFHLRRVTADYAKQVIANGVAGTAMPAWKTKLDEKQRAAVAEYVRGFFEE